MLDIPIEQARNTLDTNTLGMLRLAQAVFPHMATQKRGTFLTIGSVGGQTVRLFGVSTEVPPLNGSYAAYALGRRILREQGRCPRSNRDAPDGSPCFIP